MMLLMVRTAGGRRRMVAKARPCLSKGTPGRSRLGRDTDQLRRLGGSAARYRVSLHARPCPAQPGTLETPPRGGKGAAGKNLAVCGVSWFTPLVAAAATDLRAF